MASIPVKVVPSSSRNQICGWHGKQLKIKVQAPPEGGRANKAVVELLRKRFGLKKSAVQIVVGKTSVDKVLEVSGVSKDDIMGMQF